MKKRTYLSIVTLFLVTLIASACSGKEAETKVDKTVKDSVEEVDVENEVEAEEKEEEPEETPEKTTDSGEFASIIEYMENETEGTANVLFENSEPQLHKLDDLSVTLDAYSLVELKDFHMNYSIPFNDQTDGGVILAHYTITNDSKEDAYYMPSFNITYTGAQKAYSDKSDLIPEEDALSLKLSYKDDYLLKSGETISGYQAYTFGQDHLEEILDLTTVTVLAPPGHSVKDDFGSRIGKEGTFTLSLNEEGTEKVAANEAFYQDRATVDNMGEKKMLVEKANIDRKEEIRDVTVKLDGYQFTEFIPNKVEAPRFSNFTNGIVLLTVKFEIDNKGSEDIGLSSISSKLTVNDGAQYLLNEGMLMLYRNDEIIKAGESGELLSVYTLDLEQYEKIWKNKKFEIEIGPMRNPEAKDISKGKKATFVLPN